MYHLQLRTQISDLDHSNRDSSFIYSQMHISHKHWCVCKKKSANMHHQFLEERAELFAQKLRCTKEKALQAIIKAVEARTIYRNIRELLRKEKTSLTQIDITPIEHSQIASTTLTLKRDVEHHILCRKCNHSLQSLHIPFMSYPALQNSINPEYPLFADQLLDGTFLDSRTDLDALKPSERAWISSLKTIINQEISLSIWVDNFKHFFKGNRNVQYPHHQDATWGIIKPWLNAYASVTI